MKLEKCGDKKCCRCGQTKPASEFWRGFSWPDALAKAKEVLGVF